MPRILIADDEPAIRRALRDILEFEDYEVDEAVDGDEALQKASAGGYDLLLLDIKMPKRDGMEVLAALGAQNGDAGAPPLPVIMISGHGTVETAVEATRLGAADFIEKPPDLNRLLVSVRGALDKGVLQTENRRMKQTLTDAETAVLTPIVGESSAIQDIKTTVARVAPTEARVLITGEAGTGKELVARWLHAQSHRKGGPLVEVNCAAIPSELIESELFGHEKGAFTGATKQRIGKFEQADGGTLFLDEIGDMALPAQAKVLRALQESRITRVGGDASITVDVRVVAATNKDLLEQIDEKQFREDLYHRLSVILVHVPPLRERRADVPAIAQYLLGEVARRNGMPPPPFTAGRAGPPAAPRLARQRARASQRSRAPAHPVRRRRDHGLRRGPLRPPRRRGRQSRGRPAGPVREPRRVPRRGRAPVRGAPPGGARVERLENGRDHRHPALAPVQPALEAQHQAGRVKAGWTDGRVEGWKVDLTASRRPASCRSGQAFYVLTRAC